MLDVVLSWRGDSIHANLEGYLFHCRTAAIWWWCPNSIVTMDRECNWLIHSVAPCAVYEEVHAYVRTCIPTYFYTYTQTYKHLKIKDFGHIRTF